MRHYLAIFLLIFMPLQLSWAVVAAYCQHEQVATKTHLGHHQHEHQADQDAAKPAGKLAKGTTDADCAACHVAATPLIINLSEIHFAQTGSALASLYHWPANSAPASTIERPQWDSLA